MSTHSGLVTGHGCFALASGVSPGGTCTGSHEILFTEDHERYPFTSGQINTAPSSVVPAVHKIFGELPSLPHPSPILTATLNGRNGQPGDPFSILDLPISKHSFASTTSCQSLYSDTLHSIDNQHEPDDSIDDSSSSALDMAEYPSALTNTTLSDFTSFCHDQLISDCSSPSAMHQFTGCNIAPKSKVTFPLCSPSAILVDDNDEETDIVPNELIQFVSESTRRIQGELADAVSVGDSDLEALDHEARLASLCLPILQPPSIISSHLSDGLRPPSLSPEPITDNYSDTDFPKAYFSESMVIDPVFHGSEGTSFDISASLPGISPEDRSISTSPLAFSVSDGSSPQITHLSTTSSELLLHTSVGTLGTSSPACDARISATRITDIVSHTQNPLHDNGKLQQDLDLVDSPLSFRSLPTQEPLALHQSNLESHVVRETDVSNIASPGPIAPALQSQRISTIDGIMPLMDFSLLSNTPNSCRAPLLFKVDDPGASCENTSLKPMENTQSSLTISTHNSVCNGLIFSNGLTSQGSKDPSIDSVCSAADLYDRGTCLHSELPSINALSLGSVLLTSNSQPIVTNVYTAPPVTPVKNVSSPFFFMEEDSVNVASSSPELRFISPNYVNFNDSSKLNIPLAPSQPATEILSRQFLLTPSTHSPRTVSPQTNLTFQLLSSLPALRPGMSILLNLAGSATNGFVNANSSSVLINTSAHLAATKSNNAVVLLPSLAGTTISGATGTAAPLSYQPNFGLPPTSPTSPLVVIPPVSSSNPVTLAASLAPINVPNGVGSILGARLPLPLTTHVFLLRSPSKPQVKQDPSAQHVLLDQTSAPLSRLPLIVTPATSQEPAADPGKLLLLPSLVPISASNTSFSLSSLAYESIAQSVYNSGSALNVSPLVATSFNTGTCFETVAAPVQHEFNSFNPGVSEARSSSLSNNTASHHTSLTSPNSQIFSFPLTLFPNANSHTIFPSSWSASPSQPKCITAQSFLSPTSTVPSTVSVSSLPFNQCSSHSPSPPTCSVDAGDLLTPSTNPLTLVSLFPPTFSSVSCVNSLATTTGSVSTAGDAVSKSHCSPKPECGKGIVLPSADNLLSSRPMTTFLSSSGSVLIQPSKPLDNTCQSTSCGSSSHSSGDTGSLFLCNSSSVVSTSNRRRHQCPFCPKSCERKDNLQAHIRTHTGERPYPCRFCPKAFPQKDHLRAHIRTHTGEKPYRCPQCMKAFAQLGNLHRHVKTHRR